MGESCTKPPLTCYSCDRLNSSTFLIVENDKYNERPFIYVRIIRSRQLIVISDTGCGGVTSDTELSTEVVDSLRGFIETYPVVSNGSRPLNPRLPGGKPSFRYLIICTHCHYDHILGIPGFQDAAPMILASSHQRSFIENDLAKHSLCYYLNVPTPKYKVTYWAQDMESLQLEDALLGLQVLHTPGHTPDELAWYDEKERHLYVGDSFYERVAKDRSYTQPIIFPKEGNIVDYMSSLEKLGCFVKEENSKDTHHPVVIGCGHVTSAADGQDILESVLQFFWDIIGGKIPVKQSEERRGEVVNLWQADGEPRFSMSAPQRLVVDARRHYNLGPSDDASSIIA
ncbi:hypothetical protein MMC24_005387 [Lignoscripta atroalba]|nr:hypothetical protein [Lignoscripta atroalba]